MRKYIFIVIFLLTGCSTTTTFLLENNQNQSYNTGVDYNISVTDGPSSILSKHFSNGFCGLNLEASVTKVYEASEWDSYSKIMFSNSVDNQIFEVLFYFDRSTRKIRTLIVHDKDDGAEALNKDFNIGEVVTVIIYSEKNEINISIEPASKMENILSVKKNEEHTETFEFLGFEVGFRPDKVKFLGSSVESFFENITFRDDC